MIIYNYFSVFLYRTAMYSRDPDVDGGIAYATSYIGNVGFVYCQVYDLALHLLFEQTLARLWLVFQSI